MLEFFFSLSNPFVGYPLRCLTIGMMLLVLGYSLRPRRTSVVVTGIAWIIFGLLEAEAIREHANIRVDLFVTWPIVLIITAINSVRWFLALLRNSTTPQLTTPRTDAISTDQPEESAPDEL